MSLKELENRVDQVVVPEVEPESETPPEPVVETEPDDGSDKPTPDISGARP